MERTWKIQENLEKTHFFGPIGSTLAASPKPHTFNSIFNKFTKKFSEIPRTLYQVYTQYFTQYKQKLTICRDTSTHKSIWSTTYNCQHSVKCPHWYTEDWTKCARTYRCPAWCPCGECLFRGYTLTLKPVVIGNTSLQGMSSLFNVSRCVWETGKEKGNLT